MATIIDSPLPPKITEIMHPSQSQTYTQKEQSDYTAAYIIGSIFIIIWVALGVGAFIMSLVCFGYSGTTAQQVIGLVLAMFFGPFYWIYYGVVKNYCKKQIPRRR